MCSTILFLCTGNYYRSRFAEIVFNHLARTRGLPWRAVSRGLREAVGEWKTGPISPYALAGLEKRGIDHPEEHREPVVCREEDLRGAARVVALKEAEHRPLLAESFPEWVERVEYWHIHDIDGSPPDEALPAIEKLVEGLLDRLGATVAQHR